MQTPRYQIVNRNIFGAGCGRSIREMRTFILDTQTDKLVRDVGAAKYAQAAAEKLAAAMNEKAV